MELSFKTPAQTSSFCWTASHSSKFFLNNESIFLSVNLFSELNKHPTAPMQIVLLLFIAGVLALNESLIRAVTFSRSSRPSSGIKSQMKKERTNVYQLTSVFSLLKPALIFNPNNLSGAGSQTLMRCALIKSGTFFFPTT